MKLLEGGEVQRGGEEKRREKDLYSLDSGDYRHRCGCGSSCYAVYRYLTPDYLEDFDDDFDDDLRTRIWTRRNLKKEASEEKKED